MRPRRVQFTVHWVPFAATTGLLLLCAESRPCLTGPVVPCDLNSQAQPQKDNRAAADLASLDPSNLLWLARDANRRGKYDEAARHARAVTRRREASPEVLCPAWMNVFYAAHRTGDREAAAAAIRSFDESAVRLPANAPVLSEMAELKQAWASVVPSHHQPLPPR